MRKNRLIRLAPVWLCLLLLAAAPALAAKKSRQALNVKHVIVQRHSISSSFIKIKAGTYSQ